MGLDMVRVPVSAKIVVSDQDVGADRTNNRYVRLNTRSGPGFTAATVAGQRLWIPPTRA